MSKTNDGGPAFPVTPLYEGNTCTTYSGMSRRDVFAAMAMQGLMQEILYGDNPGIETVASAAKRLGIDAKDWDPKIHRPMLVVKDSVRYADALLAALDGGDDE